MAMEFFDCFPYLTNAAMLTLWSGKTEMNVSGGTFNNGTTTVAFGTSLGRFAGQVGMSMAGTRGDACGSIFINLPNAATRHAAATYFLPLGYTGGLTAQVFPLFIFGDLSSNQISFVIDAAGKMNVLRGTSTTPIATGSLVITNNNWHRFEFKVTVDPSAGLAECYVDGVLAVSFSGNTRFTANSYSNRLYFCSGGAFTTVQMVDPIVYSTTGDAPTGYIGDKRFYVNYPSGAGAVSQYSSNTSPWTAATVVPIGTTILDSNGHLQRVESISGTGTTGGSAPTWNSSGGTTTDNAGGNQVIWRDLGTPANYKLVNETNPDDNYSYLSDSTSGHEEGFTFPTLPSTVTGIVGVGIISRSWKDAAGGRSQRLEFKSVSTVADNGADIPVLSNPSYIEAFFAKDPNTAAAWTKTAVDNVEARIKTGV
jgi:hypothetical protein